MDAEVKLHLKQAHEAGEVSGDNSAFTVTSRQPSVGALRVSQSLTTGVACGRIQFSKGSRGTDLWEVASTLSLSLKCQYICRCISVCCNLPFSGLSCTTNSSV